MSEHGAYGRDGLMAVAAVRYCLSRDSYIVADCVEWLRSGPRLPLSTLRLIRDEIREAVEGHLRNQRPPMPGEPPFDVRGWTAAVEAVELALQSPIPVDVLLDLAAAARREARRPTHPDMQGTRLPLEPVRVGAASAYLSGDLLEWVVTINEESQFCVSTGISIESARRPQVWLLDLAQSLEAMVRTLQRAEVSP